MASEIMTPDNAEPIVARKFGGLPGYNPQEIKSGLVLSCVGCGGTRKTTFSGTAIESEYGRPMHIWSMNSNAHVLKPSDDIFVTPVESQAHIDRLIDDYERGYNDDIRFISLDHFSAMYNAVLAEQDDKDPRASYNKTQQWAIRATRRLITMAEKRKPSLSVLFIFQEVTEGRVQEDENGIPQAIQRREVNLSNKMQGYFPSMVPFMGFMRYGLNRAPWPVVFDMRPSWNTQAKFQPNGGLLARIESGEKIPLEMWNPSMATLLDTLVGGQPWPKGKHDRP